MHWITLLSLILTVTGQITLPHTDLSTDPMGTYEDEMVRRVDSFDRSKAEYPIANMYDTHMALSTLDIVLCANNTETKRLPGCRFPLSRTLKFFQVSDKCGKDTVEVTKLNFDVRPISYTQFSCQKDSIFTKDCRSCKVGARPSTPLFGFESMDDFECNWESARLGARLGIKQYKINTDIDTCQLGVYKMQECKSSNTVVEQVQWIIKDGTPYVVKHLNLAKFFEPLNKKTYTCNDGSVSCGPCALGECWGDLEFCANFQCPSSQRTATSCVCSLVKEAGEVFYIQDGVRTDIDCWGKSTMPVAKKLSIQSIPENKHDCTNCVAECKDGKIKVSTNSEPVLFYKFCTAGICNSEVVNSESFSIILKLEQRVSKCDSHIDLWFDNFKEPTEIPIKCELEDVCNVIQCNFCYEKIMNMKCYSSYHWAGVLMIIMLISGLMGLTLNTILIFLAFGKLIIRVLLNLVSIISRFFFRKGLNTGRRVYRQMDEEVALDRVYNDIVEPVNANRVRPAKFSLRAATMMSLMFCVCVIPICESCSQFTQYNIPAKYCSYSIDGIETCTITDQMRVSISPIGQTSCISMVDSETKTIGSMQITTKSVDLICDKKSEYYTFNPTVECISKHSCSHAGLCWGSDCESVRTNTSLTNLDYDSEKLGWNGCDRVCGCAGCGCFYCTASCLFHRRELKNADKKAYEILTCPTWSYSVELEVNIQNGAMNTTSRIVIGVGQSQSVGNAEFTINSISIPPQPILGTCFMRNQNNEYSHTECSRQTELIKGKVGEVQCPSEYSALSNDKSCFSDPNFIQSSNSEYGITCRSSYVDVTKIFESNKLPSVTGNTMLYNKGNNIMSSTSGESIFDLTVTTDSYDLIAKVDNSKCFIEFKKLSGCYNCLSGATVEYVGNTNFGSASAIVTCQDHKMSVSLNSKKSSYLSVMRFDEPNINFNCSVSCPAGITYFDMIGELHYIPNTNPLNINQTTGFAETENGFSLGWKWPGIFSMYIDIFLIILLLLVVLFIIYKGIMMRIKFLSMKKDK